MEESNLLLPSEYKRLENNKRRKSLKEKERRRKAREKLVKDQLPIKFMSFEIVVEIGTGCWYTNKGDRIKARKTLLDSCNSSANLDDRCSKNPGCLHPLHLVKES